MGKCRRDKLPITFESIFDTVAYPTSISTYGAIATVVMAATDHVTRTTKTTGYSENSPDSMS